MGGAACAALFQRAGYHVDVYEQAPQFNRLGAGIHLGPNCVRILNHIGIGPQILEIAVRPAAWNSLMWDSGECLFSLPLREVAEQRYGAAYVTMHRGDMHSLLIDAVLPGAIQFGKRLVDLDQDASCVRMSFADGSSASAESSSARTGFFRRSENGYWGRKSRFIPATSAIAPGSRREISATYALRTTLNGGRPIGT